MDWCIKCGATENLCTEPNWQLHGQNRNDSAMKGKTCPKRSASMGGMKPLSQGCVWFLLRPSIGRR